MGILTKILSAIDILKQIFDFISAKIQENKRKKEKKAVEDLSEKTKNNIENGDLDDINKNIM